MICSYLRDVGDAVPYRVNRIHKFKYKCRYVMQGWFFLPCDGLYPFKNAANFAPHFLSANITHRPQNKPVIAAEIISIGRYVKTERLLTEKAAKQVCPILCKIAPTILISAMNFFPQSFIRTYSPKRHKTPPQRLYGISIGCAAKTAPNRILATKIIRVSPGVS